MCLICLSVNMYECLYIIFFFLLSQALHIYPCPYLGDPNVTNVNQLSAAVAGRISRMASHDAVHNRTVNLKGGPNNMSWDRAIEIFNQEFLRKCSVCLSVALFSLVWIVFK